jgi:hypothetical protein
MQRNAGLVGGEGSGELLAHATEPTKIEQRGRRCHRHQSRSNAFAKGCGTGANAGDDTVPASTGG